MPARVLNLLFHGIGVPERELEPGEDAYWITHELFHRVLDEVADREDVRLSFDDGNRSDVGIGLPALQQRGQSATFFVLAGRLDQPGSLGPDDVRHLLAEGMVVGTHGMDHRSWRGLDPASRERELVTAREQLSEVTGAAVDEAALPLGQYDRHALGALKTLGYTHVHTSDRRWARPGAWLQPRFSVRHDDTIESLRANVLRPQRWPVRGRLAVVGVIKQLR